MADKDGFKGLQVYERSYRALLAIYRLTMDFPRAERDTLTDQMRRASMSISLNIAEGYAKRDSQKEFKRFLMMAIGSANEMSVLIDFAKDLGFMDEEKHRKASQEYDEIGRMLNVFIQTVEKNIHNR